MIHFAVHHTNLGMLEHILSILKMTTTCISVMTVMILQSIKAMSSRVYSTTDNPTPKREKKEEINFLLHQKNKSKIVVNKD